MSAAKQLATQFGYDAALIKSARFGAPAGTYYRRRAKARERAALAAAIAAREAVLDRLQWQIAELA